MPPSITTQADRMIDAANNIRARGPFLIRLYVFPPSPIAPNYALSGVLEASFPGYAPIGLVEVGAPALDGSGNEVVWKFNLVEFVNTGTGISVTVYGYYVTDAGGDWVWSQAFATPVTLTDPDQDVVIVPVLKVMNLHP